MNSRPVFHRRALAAILIIVSSSFVALSGVANAALVSTTVDGVIYSLSGTGGGGDPYIATVMGYSGPDAVLTIHSTVVYNGLTFSVTSIDADAFYADTALTSITIPNSVTSIGNGAFYLNIALTSIVIPNSVTSIGNGAFLRDSHLTSVTVGNSVTAIGEQVFEEDPALTSITIPNSVTSIGTRAFYLNTALTSITIPNSVTSISDYAFYYDTALTSITIPNSVTSIGIFTFYHDTALTSVTIGSSVTSIGHFAFNGDSALSFINPSGLVATWTGAGVSYTTAQLRTATDIGTVTGTWASVVHAEPIVYSKPTAPTNVVATMNNGSATISFTAGSSGNLPTYDEIDMFINGLSVGNVCNVTGASMCPISNLGPDVSFTFSVTAINSKGSAVSTVSNTVSYSSPVFVSATTTPPPTTTTTAPPVKRTITCVRGATSKKITAVSPVCPAGYKKK